MYIIYEGVGKQVRDSKELAHMIKETCKAKICKVGHQTRDPGKS